MPFERTTMPDPSLFFTSTKRHRSLWSRSQQFDEHTSAIFVPSGTWTSASICVAGRPPTVMACGDCSLNSGRDFSQAYKSFGQGRYGSLVVAPATVVDPMSRMPTFCMSPVNTLNASGVAPWSSRPKSISAWISWFTFQPPANEKLIGTAKTAELKLPEDAGVEVGVLAAMVAAAGLLLGSGDPPGVGGAEIGEEAPPDTQAERTSAADTSPARPEINVARRRSAESPNGTWALGDGCSRTRVLPAIPGATTPADVPTRGRGRVDQAQARCADPMVVSNRNPRRQAFGEVLGLAG